MIRFDDFLYASLGIALCVSPLTGEALDNPRIYQASYRADMQYVQPTTQLNVMVYSINKESYEQPKRDFRSLYASISASGWFDCAYRGKSLGEYIEVEL